MIVWRPPLLAEALELAARVSGVPLADFERQERLEALNDALDIAPPRVATSRAVGQRAFSYRLGEMATSILRSPSLPEGPRLAEALTRLTIERSGASWKLDGLSAVLGMRSWEASGTELRTLADWFSREVEIPRLHRPDRVDWSRKCRSQKRDVPFQRDWVADPNAPIHLPGLYVAGPFSHLVDGSRPHVELVHDDVARGLELALAWLPLAVPIRLLHPSSLLAENQVLSDARWLALSRDWMLEGADGLILSDVAQRAPGFGAGVEAALYCGCSGPSLIVLDSACGDHSRFERGLAGDIRGEVISLGPTDALAAVVARWFATCYEDFLAAWRRRQNSRIVHARRYEQVCALIAQASDDELVTACERSGLSISQLRLVTQSVAMMGAVPWTKLESFFRILRIRRPTRRRTSPSNRIDLEALREAARQQRWSGRTTATLLHDARRELARAGTDHRLVLLSAEDWVALYERLHGTG